MSEDNPTPMDGIKIEKTTVLTEDEKLGLGEIFARHLVDTIEWWLKPPDLKFGLPTPRLLPTIKELEDRVKILETELATTREDFQALERKYQDRVIEHETLKAKMLTLLTTDPNPSR